MTTLEALKLADPGKKTERDLEDDELEMEQAELVKMEWLKGGAGRKKRCVVDDRLSLQSRYF